MNLITRLCDASPVGLRLPDGLDQPPGLWFDLGGIESMDCRDCTPVILLSSDYMLVVCEIVLVSCYGPL
jgi:hypothetical protein